MAEALRLMCVLAHPDDESLGVGGILARYASEGIETSVITATRGHHGWFGDPADYPGPEALGELRETELRAACKVLGVNDLFVLNYMDGELDMADPDEVSLIIASLVRRVRPHVVVSFGPDGIYGHPDHIAICQFAAAAIVRAADTASTDPLLVDIAPHVVSKFYYRVATGPELAAYEAAFGKLVMHIDGVARGIFPWEEWAATASLDNTAYAPRIWDAIACHRSQLPGYSRLFGLPEEQRRDLRGTEYYYRVHSLVNGGRHRETDLFAGLR